MVLLLFGCCYWCFHQFIIIWCGVVVWLLSHSISRSLYAFVVCLNLIDAVDVTYVKHWILMIEVEAPLRTGCSFPICFFLFDWLMFGTVNVTHLGISVIRALFRFGFFFFCLFWKNGFTHELSTLQLFSILLHKVADLFDAYKKKHMIFNFMSILNMYTVSKAIWFSDIEIRFYLYTFAFNHCLLFIEFVYCVVVRFDFPCHQKMLKFPFE